MTIRVGLAIVLLLVIACHPFDEIEDVADFEAVKGRCVRLRQSLALFDSGGDKAGAVYIDSTDMNKQSISLVPTGSEIIIRRVIHEKSFEYTRVAVIGDIRGGPSGVIVSRLFSERWLNDARRSQDDSRRPETLIELDGQRAEWCR